LSSRTCSTHEILKLGTADHAVFVCVQFSKRIRGVCSWGTSRVTEPSFKFFNACLKVSYSFYQLSIRCTAKTAKATKTKQTPGP